MIMDKTSKTYSTWRLQQSLANILPASEYQSHSNADGYLNVCLTIVLSYSS